MPLMTSPHLLPAAEISKVIKTQEDQEDIFSTDLPVRTQVSPSTSPQLYQGTMSTADADRAFVPSNDQHMQQAPMIVDRESMQWSAQGRFPQHNLTQEATTLCAPAFFAPPSGCMAYPQQAQNGMAINNNYVLSYPTQYSSSCPRVYNGIDFTGLPTSDMTASYPPATFLHSPPHLQPTPSLPDTSTPELMQFNNDYDLHYSQHVKYEDQLDYNSPYSDMSRASTPYSTGHEEDSPIDKEQPYAQLIYRCLLDAPDNTMVLRDIYDWFERHTDKASHSETKGWQNSIRHNLSMNGAFEKVDSPADATTKGFMWRLTPDAIREGVKSTTRYRSKAPNRRSSGHTQPLPQRQASGAKGGHAARRSAHLRRSQRAREAMSSGRPTSDPYGCGYGSEWEGESVYTPSTTAFPSRVNTPYSQHNEPHTSYSPYQAPKSPSTFLSMASHAMSPPRSYGSTLVTPNTPFNSTSFPLDGAVYVLEQAPGGPLFAGSPTPSTDEPITPTDRRGGWDQDVALGIDVFDDMSYAGNA